MLTRFALTWAIVLGMLVALGIAAPGGGWFSAREERSQGKDAPPGQFDDTLTQLIERQRPAHVLLGNSMMDSRIDERVLSKALDAAVVKVWYGGAASAAWYAMLKNHILEAKHHPRSVTLFFRDDMLVRPHFRTTGRYGRLLDRHRREGDTEIDLVLAGAGVSARARLIGRLERGLGVEAIHRQAEQRLFGVANWMTGVLVGTAPLEERRSQVRQAFAAGQGQGEDQEADQDKEAWGEAVPIAGSFLPEMIRLTQEADIRLNLVRVQRSRHHRRRVTAEQREQLAGRVAELREYCSARGVRWLDLNGARWIKDEWYQGRGDHIRSERRRAYTKAFIRRHEDLFEGDLDAPNGR